MVLVSFYFWLRLVWGVIMKSVRRKKGKGAKALLINFYDEVLQHY